MAPARKLGVFCLEGPWSSLLTDDSSVRPLLEVLERRGAIRFAHRDAITREEFDRYLLQWTQKQYRHLKVGYLAFHGEPGALRVGSHLVSLQELQETLRGRLVGRVLYFGSCATMQISRKEAEEFQRATKARAVLGYTQDIDWIESAAFELNLLDALGRFQRIDASFRHLRNNHSGMVRRLGLRAVWSTGHLWTRLPRDPRGQ